MLLKSFWVAQKKNELLVIVVKSEVKQISRVFFTLHTFLLCPFNLVRIVIGIFGGRCELALISQHDGSKDV